MVTVNDDCRIVHGGGHTLGVANEVCRLVHSWQVNVVAIARVVEATLNLMDMQAGDVPATWADARLLKELTGYAPQTDIRTGIEQFVAWYRDYYQI